MNIEGSLSPRALKLLRSFSTLANKSTGSAHPLDEQRWFAFIIAVHKDGSPLDAGTLGRWLIEDEAWPEDSAHTLTIEYEVARSLLKAYDGQC